MKILRCSKSGLFAAICFFTCEGTALAEPRQNPRLLIGVERISGVFWSSNNIEGRSDALKTLSINLLTPGTILASPFAHPLLSFHSVLDSGVTLGSGFGYSVLKQEEDNDSLSALILSPRVGYLFSLGSASHFWLRGGITHHRIFTENSSRSGTAISLDPTFIFPVSRNFSITLAPVVDLDLAGKIENDISSESRGAKFTTFGLAFGVLGSL